MEVRSNVVRAKVTWCQDRVTYGKVKVRCEHDNVNLSHDIWSTDTKPYVSMPFSSVVLLVH